MHFFKAVSEKAKETAMDSAAVSAFETGDLLEGPKYARKDDPSCIRQIIRFVSFFTVQVYESRRVKN